MKIVKTIVLLTLGGCLLSVDAGIAAPKKKNKKTAQTEQKAPTKPESDYDKLFKAKKVETAKGLLTLHRVDDKLYVEVPLKLLGRDMLIGSTVSETSVNRFAIVGEKPQAPLQFRFTKDGKKLSIREAQYRYVSTDANLEASIRLNSLPGILKSYDIKAYSPDSLAVVVDMTDLFVGDEARLSPFPSGAGIGWGSYQVSKAFKRDMSQLTGIKAFDDNVSIRSSLTYAVTVKNPRSRLPLYDNMPFTTIVTRSIVLLPEEPMRPRIADPRIGIFYQRKSKFANHSQGAEAVYYANRWRLEPNDEEAFSRGELVEPKQPIVFYIDDAFPENWKPYVKKGVEQWQAAFERIGFKNAIVARDFPKDDPEFDPDNLKYNCVRYAPSWITNAMGPSWTDPRSGEVLNASVYVYHNLAKLVQSWRYVQTAAADPDVRSMELPEDIQGDCIRYVLAHEVGHCLSLMHNMSASAAIPVDSLRSPSFTQKYGTTYSIMDYARNNFVAQPGDKERGVRLTPPDLGEYDYYAISWLYKPIPDAKTPEEEVPTLNRWISEKSGDPIYRYGKQQFSVRIDPSSFEEDLGDDPVRAAEYGISNLKYILGHLNEWIGSEDNDFEFRRSIYNAALVQYQTYLMRVLINIGGVYLNECYDGDKMDSYKPVPATEQRRSARFILNALNDAAWWDAPDLKRVLPLSGDMGPSMANNLFKGLIMRTGMLAYASQLMGKEAYTQADFLGDIHNMVWKPTRSGRTLTAVEKQLQLQYLSYLLGNSDVFETEMKQQPPFQLTAASAPIKFPEGVKERYEADFGIAPAHLFGPDEQTAAALAQRAALDGEVMGFAPFAGLQGTVPSPAHTCFGLLQKSLSLLKSRTGSGSEDTRQHYRLLIHQIEQKLK